VQDRRRPVDDWNDTGEPKPHIPYGQDRLLDPVGYLNPLSGTEGAGPGYFQTRTCPSGPYLFPPPAQSLLSSSGQ